MSPRPTAKKTINTPLQNRRKPSQRQRLLEGMVATANRDGYAGANVSAVIAEAGVSRPTFYEHFEDRDDCFVAAIAEIHQRLHADVREAIAAGAPERALVAAIEATVAFARADPPDARFLMQESLAGVPVAPAARARDVKETAKLVEQAFKQAAGNEPVPDIPVAAALGATHRVLAARLRREEPALGGLEQELARWVESYGAPAGKRRWRKLRSLRVPGRSPYLPATALRAPAKFGPGRAWAPSEEVAENQRQRIMFATAEVVQRRGYAAATNAEIMRLAGVEGSTFYRLFAGKQDAFSAVHELGFQYLMAATAGAFFAAERWPERVWEAFRATTQSIDDIPAFAHVAFVEAYAIGPPGIKRVEDSRAAFAIFLQEGYRYEGAHDSPPSRLALEAIITTVFEIVYLQTRAHGQPKTAGLLALLVYVCLAPFIGPGASNEFIDERLAEIREARRSTRVA